MDSANAIVLGDKIFIYMLCKRAILRLIKTIKERFEMKRIGLAFILLLSGLSTSALALDGEAILGGGLGGAAGAAIGSAVGGRNGAIIGGGIFVLTGTGAYFHAGPALALSFIFK